MRKAKRLRFLLGDLNDEIFTDRDIKLLLKASKPRKRFRFLRRSDIWMAAMMGDLALITRLDNEQGDEQ